MEEIIDGIITVLQDGLETKLTAVTAEYASDDNTRFGQSLNMLNIREYCFGERQRMNDFPCVVVMGKSDEAQGQNKKQEVGIVYIIKHDIELHLFIWGDDEERLNRIVYRYGRAIRDTLEDNGILNRVCNGLAVERLQYTDTMRSNERKGLFKGIIVDLSVWTKHGSG